MQIRELDLKELYIVYDLVKLLYTDMSYEEFEDLIYDMRHMDYKMIGILDKDVLLAYAGVSIQTTLKNQRHLKVFDLISNSHFDVQKHNAMIKEYLQDYARTGMCTTVIY